MLRLLARRGLFTAAALGAGVAAAATTATLVSLSEASGGGGDQTERQNPFWAGRPRLPFIAPCSSPDAAPLRRNRQALGDPSVPPSCRPHRVALCGWPVKHAASQGDGRVATLGKLFAHCKDAGYDGLELGFRDFQEVFTRQLTPKSGAACGSAAAFPEELAMALRIRRAADAAGVRLYGSTTHVCDGNHEVRAATGVRRLDLQDADVEAQARRLLKLNLALGHEYTSFQMWLPPDKLHTGGAYRDDDAYLRRAAQNVRTVRRWTQEEGLSCYVETHVDRISEDVPAFWRIIRLVEEEEEKQMMELNGDLSHYIYRNITRGRAYDEVLARVQHLHVRMARVHGDLSADAAGGDVAKDWATGGITRVAFRTVAQVLARGLASRTICGESGPMGLVEDPLSMDAKLVPLYRWMAKVADDGVARRRGLRSRDDDDDAA